jgi:hypothetical protein
MRKVDQTISALNRITASCVLLLLFVCTASAYTIVMRGGKRIEIPARFQLTATTLTYEAGPEIQITLQLAAIDILATEKANNETAGSFLRRVGATGSGIQLQTEPAPARRTITNRDLESSLARRRQSEVAYEKRRQELGLPSAAESRRRAEIESVQIQTELGTTRAVEKESEGYWRARASALRTEMAAIDAELNYLRVRLEDLPQLASGFTSFSVLPFFTSGVSFGNGGFGSRFPHNGGPRQLSIYGAPQSGSRLTARVGVGFGGSYTRGQGWGNNGAFRRSRSFGVGFPFPIVSSVGAFGSGYDYSYERSALITHFNNLAATRAGINARWRELEDEARRAGAPPGWLRP